MNTYVKVEILGLDFAAQSIVLQGLSTYTALASAYFFARPVLRGQAMKADLEVLSSLESKDPDITDLLKISRDFLNRSAQREQLWTQRDNRWGVSLLFVSVLLFTAAVSIQVFTNP